MGIPRKGSRRLVVDGKEYRYLIRPDGQFVENDDPSIGDREKEFLLVTVQEDSDRPGRILQWRWPNGAAVMPDDIKSAVMLALERGWVPSERGGTFVLGDQ